ncbi:hypothetical protein ED733_007312 [Metarhizium rileyi]|nr:hypothetical protein ED733_007312 [Metarhizium rileyi]
MNSTTVQAQQALNAYGPVSSPHIFDRTSSKKIFASMLGSRRTSSVSTPAESRRPSATSTTSNKKNKKIKLPTVILPSFRFVN